MFVDEKAVGETAEQKNRKLKLSEAIRIGAQYRPQCQGAWFSSDGSCALGAAYEALHGYGNIAGFQRIDNHGNNLMEALGAPPSFLGEITWRNDHAGMTREQIADWLEAKGY